MSVLVFLLMRQVMPIAAALAGGIALLELRANQRVRSAGACGAALAPHAASECSCRAPRLSAPARMPRRDATQHPAHELERALNHTICEECSQ